MDVVVDSLPEAQAILAAPEKSSRQTTTDGAEESPSAALGELLPQRQKAAQVRMTR